MLKKTISYENYNGEMITEDFYFNLTKKELMDMEMSEKDGLDEVLKKMIAAQDTKSLMDLFADLILQAYGEKSPDGRHFIKSPEIRSKFKHTEVYSDLFFELATNEDEAIKFVNGIVPKSLVGGETVELPTAAPVLEPPTPPEDTRPAWIREDREPTRTELSSMSREELVYAFSRKNQS